MIKNENLSPVEKEVIWLNSVNHYLSDHSSCLDPNHKSSILLKFDHITISALSDLLFKSWCIATKVMIICQTQINEAPHLQKKLYADKMHQWDSFLEARIVMAILSMNEDYDWTKTLRERLKLPDLPDSIQKHLDENFKKKMEQKSEEIARIQR